MQEEETKMTEKFKLFEEKIQMASQTAQDALDDMEKWRRRRVLLEQPIIKFRSFNICDSKFLIFSKL